jgi:hypothetical protein
MIRAMRRVSGELFALELRLADRADAAFQSLAQTFDHFLTLAILF